MFVALLATVIVLAIATFQVVQGLFSSLIMAVLSILSALAAFALYEPLCQNFLYDRMPSYAHGVAFLSVFLLVLLALRELADRFLRGNVTLGLWPDRIGGGACGLLTGIVITGVLTVGIQMFPYGPRAAFYLPYDESLKRSTSLWLFTPDDFVLGMAKTLSNGGLGTDRPFGLVHDNLVQEQFCTRNRIRMTVIDEDKNPVSILVGELNGGENDFSVKGACEIVDTGELNDVRRKQTEMILRDTPADPTSTESPDSMAVVVVSVLLAPGAQDSADPWWRLPATHFRLVDAAGKAHYPLGYLFTFNPARIRRGMEYQERHASIQPGWNLVPAPTKAPEGATNTGDRARIADLGLQRPRDVAANLTVDWVFRLPRKSIEGQGIRDYYMVFRDRIRKPLTTLVRGLDKISMTEALTHEHMKFASEK